MKKTVKLSEWKEVSRKLELANYFVSINGAMQKVTYKILPK